MVCFLLRPAVGGVQLVALLQRSGGHPAPVVLAGNLGVVQIAVFPGGDDEGKALLFRFRDGGGRQAHAPGEDGVSLAVNAGLGPRLFIPEDGLFAARGEHGGHFRFKFLQFLVDVLHSLLLAVFDAERAFFPGFFQRGFVAAQVNHGGRKDVPELVKDGGIEFPYFRRVGAYQVQAHTAGRADFRVVVWKAEEFRIGGGQRLVVARHVYLRDDLNAARGAVRHQVFQFLPGVHSFVGSAVAEAFRPFGRDAFQFGIARHRQAPALVVRQVELELVEFIVGHQVHEFLQVLDGDEVARRVHHHAAPRVARLVLDDSAGNAFRMRRQLVLELLESDQSVDTALFPAGREVHSLRGDGELIGVLAQGRRGFVGKKLQGPGGVPLQLRFLRLRNNTVFFCWCGTRHGCREGCAGQEVDQFKHDGGLFQKRFYHGESGVIRKNGGITFCFPTGRVAHCPSCVSSRN